MALAAFPVWRGRRQTLLLRDPPLRLGERRDPGCIALFQQEALAARSWVLRQQGYHFAACYLLCQRVDKARSNRLAIGSSEMER